MAIIVAVLVFGGLWGFWGSSSPSPGSPGESRAHAWPKRDDQPRSTLMQRGAANLSLSGPLYSPSPPWLPPRRTTFRGQWTPRAIQGLSVIFAIA